MARMPQLKLHGARLGFLVSAIGATAFLLQGYDQAVVNGLLTLPTWERQFPLIDTSHDKSQHRAVLQGTTVAIYEVGCACGALSCFILGDLLGRRRTILLGASVVLVGVIIQASPFSLGQLIAGRVITGLGVGSFTATVPMYVAETSKAHNRGKLVMLEGWFAIGGVCFATWLDFGFYFVKNNSVNWRFPIAFQSIFALVVLSTIMFLPESPRWLVKRESYSEAAIVLAKLDEDNLDPDHPVIKEELEIIRHSIVTESVGHSSNPFALTPNRHLQRTLIAISVNLLCQMTGVNIVTFYSNTIFQNILGYDGTLSRIISGCLQIWQFICAGLAVLLIDRLGRRKLLLIGSAGMAVSQAGLAALTKYAHVSQTVAGLTLLFDFMSLFFFPIGLFLVPFMYAAEISPLRIRARVTSMSSATNWLFNFLLAEVTPVGFNSLGWKYYLVYMCTSTLAFVVFYFFVPETRGAALEDIDEFFVRATTIWQPVGIAKEMKNSPGASAGLAHEGLEKKPQAWQNEDQKAVRASGDTL